MAVVEKIQQPAKVKEPRSLERAAKEFGTNMHYVADAKIL